MNRVTINPWFISNMIFYLDILYPVAT